MSIKFQAAETDFEDTEISAVILARQTSGTCEVHIKTSVLHINR